MAWQPTKSNTLDSLLAVAGWSAGEMDRNGVPWREGDLAVYRGTGGMDVRGASHHIIAGRSLYTRVSGDRDLVVNNDMVVNVKKNHQIEAHESNPKAVDSLKVDGNMSVTTKERLTIGIGTVDRTYRSAHVRVTGMEGIICGGAWNRTYVGPLFQSSALQMGDVFGGALMGSAFRGTYNRGLFYRSADSTSTWRMGIYERNVKNCVEPVVGSPVPADGKWARRASMFSKVLFTALPMLGMAWGLLMTPMLIYALAKFLWMKYGNGKAKPYEGPTKVRNRMRVVKGVQTACRVSETII